MSNCLRCHSKLKRDTPFYSFRIKFYTCSACGSRYRLKRGQRLHDRWLMPLTLPLYSVIFEKDPVASAKSVAYSFYERKDFDLDLLKKHINCELHEPTQNISEIHDYVYPNEDELREFLKCFIVELEKLQNHS